MRILEACQELTELRVSAVTTLRRIIYEMLEMLGSETNTWVIPIILTGELERVLPHRRRTLIDLVERCELRKRPSGLFR